MVKNTDRTSAFTILALLAAALLAAAAGVLWWQWSSSDGDSAVNAEAVGVAYTLVNNATLSLAGTSEHRYERLASSLERLGSLRASSDALPGDPRAWTSLEENARALLDARENAETLRSASLTATTRIDDLLAASDPLLQVSGAVAVVQEFQRRALDLQTELARLPDQVEATEEAGQVRDHLAYLSQVTAALAGQESELDVAALSASNQEAVLAPLAAILSDVEAAGAAAVTANGYFLVLRVKQCRCTQEKEHKKDNTLLFHNTGVSIFCLLFKDKTKQTNSLQKKRWGRIFVCSKILDEDCDRSGKKCDLVTVFYRF
jgi:hypothetical protein